MPSKKSSTSTGAKKGKKTVAQKAPAKQKATAQAKAAPAKKKTVAKKAPAKKTATRKAAPSGPVVGPAGRHAPYKPKRGEEYMSDPQRDHFRSILLEWKHDLMEEVDRTVHHMQDEAANFPDPNDRATQESEFSLELRTRDRERKLIKKIDESIANIDSDDYGYCESCGVEIGIRRLEARPTATQCIDCKTLDEIREKQMIG